MNDATLQLTIRGIDQNVKDALVKKANQQGLSLNRYALNTLKNSTGVNDSEQRYHALKQFLSNHSVNKTDKKAFDEAIKWSDKTSLEKHRKEERDTRF
jgi:hypothetical protein